MQMKNLKNYKLIIVTSIIGSNVQNDNVERAEQYKIDDKNSENTNIEKIQRHKKVEESFLFVFV